MPTPLPQLAESIVVGQLQTSLENATVLSPATPAQSGLKELRRLNFDQAPVVEDGTPVGYVLARDLASARSAVAPHVRPILPDALASELSSLDDVLPWLQRTGFLFVLRGRSISGFVVPSDLNRQAGRAYFFLAVTALELEIAEIVRDLGRHENILTVLTKEDAALVERRLRRRTRANVEADVVAEMNLAHLFHILGTRHDILKQLGFEDERAWALTSADINRVRLRVAHPVKPLLESQDELEWLVEAGQRVHDLLRRLTTRQTS